MKKTLGLLTGVSALVLAGCATGDVDVPPAIADVPPVEEEVVEDVEAAVDEVMTAVEEMAEPVVMTSAERLQAVLDGQPEEVQARYGARHPGETLALFGIEPGMTVIEALPGGGWYSKILIEYLGPEGTLMGAQYPDDMWLKIMPDASPERIERFIQNGATWAETAEGWDVPGAGTLASYNMTTLGEDEADMADAALFIRALHNMNRADEDRSTFTKAIAETYRILKPGGVVGVVQHRGPEGNSDEWAIGNAGYLKQSYVVASFEAAGFVLDQSSEINANPADMPSEDDMVWRLPPSLATTEEGTPEQDAFKAIGESDRMTLKFVKPVEKD
ncbi:MAG: methyltransferase [Pseudomonadota bacterium]